MILNYTLSRCEYSDTAKLFSTIRDPTLRAVLTKLAGHLSVVWASDRDQ